MSEGRAGAEDLKDRMPSPERPAGRENDHGMPHASAFAEGTTLQASGMCRAAGGGDGGLSRVPRA